MTHFSILHFGRLCVLGIGLFLGTFLYAQQPPPNWEARQAAEGKPFVAEKGMVQIKPTDKELRLSVGQKAYYSVEVHASTGLWRTASAADAAILALVAEHTDYKQPQQDGMTGGDAAVVTYVFEAKKAGETSLLLKTIVRGEAESATLKVTVAAAKKKSWWQRIFG